MRNAYIITSHWQCPKSSGLDISAYFSNGQLGQKHCYIVWSVNVDPWEDRVVVVFMTRPYRNLQFCYLYYTPSKIKAPPALFDSSSRSQ
jgi:hypothetical protein